jgi:hypothetical protein
MATGQIKIPYTPNPKQDEVFSFYRRRRGRPLLFQIISPNSRKPLLPFLLALHVNPESLEERFTKSKNVVMTYGGYVEFNWPDDLDALSASGSTGAFLGPLGGLTTQFRKETIAWERQQDLLELFHHNGMIFDANGRPILRGAVQMIYDRGIYEGFFTSFTVTEDDEHPFSFTIDWEFKVEVTTYKFPPNALNTVEISAPDPELLEPPIIQPEGAEFLPINLTEQQLQENETAFIEQPPVETEEPIESGGNLPVTTGGSQETTEARESSQETTEARESFGATLDIIPPGSREVHDAASAEREFLKDLGLL